MEAKPKLISSSELMTDPEDKDQDRFGRNQKELLELCKRRFFYRQASDIYGGVAGFYTYGPPGCAVKNNIISLWRQTFVISEHLLEIEDS